MTVNAALAPVHFCTYEAAIAANGVQIIPDHASHLCIALVDARYSAGG